MDKILTIYFFKKIQVLWHSWVYQTKSVENITWNICNSLKSEKMASHVETKTKKIFVWNSWVYQTKNVENNLEYL